MSKFTVGERCRVMTCPDHVWVEFLGKHENPGMARVKWFDGVTGALHFSDLIPASEIVDGEEVVK